MKHRYLVIILLFSTLFSCKNENQNRMAEALKDKKKKEYIFAMIDKNWTYNSNHISTSAPNELVTWKEWGTFLSELSIKPKNTLAAFQRKSANMTTKALALEVFIPVQYNIAPMKGRISLLITKVRMLDLYLHLKDIPHEKVVALIPEINTQINAMNNQMEKITRKSKIPLEEGESDLIQMLNTSRAIPNNPNVNTSESYRNTPRVE